MARMNKEDLEEIKRHFDEKANELVQASETRVMTLCAANTAMALENKTPGKQRNYTQLCATIRN